MEMKEGTLSIQTGFRVWENAQSAYAIQQADASVLEYPLWDWGVEMPEDPVEEEQNECEVNPCQPGCEAYFCALDEEVTDTREEDSPVVTIIIIVVCLVVVIAAIIVFVMWYLRRGKSSKAQSNESDTKKHPAQFPVRPQDDSEHPMHIVIQPSELHKERPISNTEARN